MIDRRYQALGGQSYDRTPSDITTIVWHYTAVPRQYNRKIWDHKRYWRNDRGWGRGGYHYYIDSDGVLYWNNNPERIT
ncbi:peptidoglycan recognition protein family protein [Facklamia hominis]|uniref:N-acetylmuramoyl-L-alanine amidase n=1 Tax=Facklamia hominis TaxID=178214 RepID=A0AAJ1Q767_9LACT|nr:N-acetylmuramoyl-L-alanine amidase [Facklamia hominis]MDK7187800.1 N-acetylmuramoyl-L-alanine amidase [Facklamia hominis]